MSTKTGRLFVVVIISLILWFSTLCGNIHAELVRAVATNDIAETQKNIESGSDTNAKEKYSGIALMVASQEGQGQAEDEKTNRNDSKQTCCQKKEQCKFFLKSRWEDLQNGRIIKFILTIPLSIGYIILWILNLIGCWLGL